MKNSKLAVLLKTFSADEMKQFDKFLSSVYFSGGRKLHPFFRIIKKYYPEFDSKVFTNEKIFSKLYPGKKYTGKKSLHLIHIRSSELFAAAEKFLVHSEIENRRDRFHFNRLLAERYLDKKLIDHSLKTALRNLELINKDDNKINYFLERIMTDMYLTGLFILKNEPKNIYKYTSNSMLYVFAFIFQILTAYHNKHRANKRNYNLDFKGNKLILQFVRSFDPDLFEEECDDDEFETKNLTLINYYLLKTFLDENDDRSFDSAFKLYKQLFSVLGHYKKYEIFLLLFNRSIGKFVHNSKYRETANKLIDLVWSKGIISNNPAMPLNSNSYISGLFIKFSLKKLKEVRYYVNKYLPLVQARDMDMLKNISEAIILFKDKRFEECLKTLSLNIRSEIKYVSGARYEMKLCCLYELKYFSQIDSLIDNFEHYSKNNKKVSEIFSSINQNFIKCVKKLKYLAVNRNVNVNKTVKEIKELSLNSAFKWWFDEKILEITG